MKRNSFVIPDGREAGPETILNQAKAADVCKMGSGLRFAAPE